MYSQEGLRYAITGLFCSRMGEDGYTMQEAEEHLDKLDFSPCCKRAEQLLGLSMPIPPRGRRRSPSTIAWAGAVRIKKAPFCMKRTTRARWRSLSPPGRWSCGCWRT